MEAVLNKYVKVIHKEAEQIGNRIEKTYKVRGDFVCRSCGKKLRPYSARDKKPPVVYYCPRWNEFICKECNNGGWKEFCHRRTNYSDGINRAHIHVRVDRVIIEGERYEVSTNS